MCRDSFSEGDATKLNVTYRHLRKKKSPAGMADTVIPAAACQPAGIPVGAALFNILTYQVAYLQAIKSKDPAFISTASYGFFLGLSFIFGPLYLILALILIKPWWLAIMAFMMVPVLGILAWNWFLLLLRTIGGFRIWNLRRTGNALFSRLQETYSKLVKRVSSL
jgi:hypothetical protein